MVTSYIQAAKLRSWLSRDDCPLMIRECQVLFEKTFATRGDPSPGEDDKVSHADSPPPAQSFSVPPDLYQLTSQCNIILHAHHHRNGVMYA